MNVPDRPPIFAQLHVQPYIRLLWRWSWLVILCTLLGGAAALLVSLNTVPIYEATSKLLINEARTPASANYNDILASERAARTYAELMTRETMLAQAMTSIGLSPDAIQGQVSDLHVTPVRDTQLVELTVEGPNPEIIAAIANALPEVFLGELRSVQTARFAESKASLRTQLNVLSRQIEETQLAMNALEDARTPQEELEYGRLGNMLSQYQTSYSGILQNYETIRLYEAQSIDNVVVMDAAVAPESPIRPCTLVNTLLASIVGGMLALGTIFLMEYLDDRIQTPDDLRRITDLPILGAIGKTAHDQPGRYEPAQLISLQQPRHPSTEAYRRLRTNLRYSSVDRSLRSLVVTSPGVGEGKSITTANLAVVMAQSGLNVVLVDCDLRRPRQHLLFGVNRSPGLTAALFEDDVTPFLRTPKDSENLWLLTSGERVPLPAEVLGSQRMQQLVDKLRQQADIMLFDTPPVLAVTDAQLVGRLSDGALLVIDTQQTTTVALHRALEALMQVNIPILGGVMNRLTDRGRGYYYTYGYYHYRTDSEETDAVKHNGHLAPAQQKHLRPLRESAPESVQESENGREV